MPEATAAAAAAATAAVKAVAVAMPAAGAIELPLERTRIPVCRAAALLNRGAAQNARKMQTSMQLHRLQQASPSKATALGTQGSTAYRMSEDHRQATTEREARAQAALAQAALAPAAAAVAAAIVAAVAAVAVAVVAVTVATWIAMTLET